MLDVRRAEHIFFPQTSQKTVSNRHMGDPGKGLAPGPQR